jgi:RimJ/RimL family protein N-acetyltransferase
MDAERVETRDGSELLVRPIGPDDREALVRGFQDLSDDSRYTRFLSPIKRLTSGELTYLTEVDHRDHEALIALTDAGELVGVARYVRLDDDPGRAEVAVTVADEWQGRGLGTILLHRLAPLARAAGIESVFGVCLSGNQDMQQLLRELGPDAHTTSSEAGLVEIEVPLPAEEETPRTLRSLLRAAAQGLRDGGA